MPLYPDDDLDDWDDEEDFDEVDDEETVPCPYCREEVHQEAERCPHCGAYISEEDAPSHRPWWIYAGVAVCLLIVLIWIVSLC